MGLGQLELIIGCMFCGKTTELIRKIDREEIAGRHVQLFKSKLDTRYSLEYISSHNKVMKPAISVDYVKEIRENLEKNVEVIGIDEIQFLDDDIIPFCLEQIDLGKKVIVSSLNLDFRGEPFKFRDSNKHIGELMPYATNITTLKAICTYKINNAPCGKEAGYSQRFIDGKPAKYDDDLILIGGKESYEARCSEHYIKPKKV